MVMKSLLDGRRCRYRTRVCSVVPRRRSLLCVVEINSRRSRESDPEISICTDEGVLFELIWRDYFRFLSIKCGNSLFHLGGPRNVQGEWSQDMKLFESWRDGKTGYPIIDANMKELSTTGFMSNRGRQAYIDFEIAEGELERARTLYECLLDRTKHYKVWVNFAKFEASGAGEGDATERRKECIRRARAIFDRANTYYKDSAPELKEERATLLEDWLNMETDFGSLGDVSVVQCKLSKKLKKRKPITIADGSTEYEEYIDYLYPIESQTTNLKILEAAYKLKKQKLAALRRIMISS